MPRITMKDARRLGLAGVKRSLATRKPKPLTPQQMVIVQIVTALGMPVPVFEHRFHPVREWSMDVAWPDARIFLEIEGGVWTGGRHTRGKGFLGDIEKYNAAAVLGWRLLRCTPEQLADGSIFGQVKEAMGLLEDCE